MKDTPTPKHTAECTLSDDELIQACNNWVHSLAKSGGDKWTLEIPVNFNRDPDMLFIELSTRFSKLKEERKWISETLKARSESLDEYNNEFFFLESILSKFPEVPSTP